jgi:hypothetical protein
MELFSYNVVVTSGFKQLSVVHTERNSSVTALWLQVVLSSKVLAILNGTFRYNVVVASGFKQLKACHTSWNSSVTMLWLQVVSSK